MSRYTRTSTGLVVMALLHLIRRQHAFIGWANHDGFNRRVNNNLPKGRTAVSEAKDPNFLEHSPEIIVPTANALEDPSSADALSKLQQQIRSMRKIILHQQKQLDELQDAVKKVTLPSATLFIDGTWLYYSLYERSSVANRLNSPNWWYIYDVDWHAVLRLISREFQVNVNEQYVYTSAKADTGSMSSRLTLFENLRKAGYNVDMQETVGPGEKCVDIKLATQMIAQDYDVGLILTGDKDFLPALTLCRQKQGKKIGLVSMREGCNRALSGLDNVRDFDVLWLEDHIAEIFVRSDSSNRNPDDALEMPQLSPTDHEDLGLIYHKVIHDFIVGSGVSCANGRDLGRHLKKIPFLQTTILDCIKSFHGGLSSYVASDKAFIVENDSDQPNNFVVSLGENMPPPEFGSSSTILKQFHELYTDKFREVLMKNKEVVYEFTYEGLREQGVSVSKPVQTYNDSMKKDELQRACEENGLSKWGTKAELITRLAEHQDASSDKATAIALPEQLYLKELLASFLEAEGGEARSRLIGGHLAGCDPFDSYHSNALSELKALYGNVYEFVTRSNGVFGISKLDDTSEYLVFLYSDKHLSTVTEIRNAEGLDRNSGDPPNSSTDATFEHLKTLLSNFLLENGGSGGSRDIGRYLVSSEPSDTSAYGHALNELKDNYGNLAGFIGRARNYFRNNGKVTGNEFEVALATESSSTIS